MKSPPSFVASAADPDSSPLALLIPLAWSEALPRPLSRASVSSPPVAKAAQQKERRAVRVAQERFVRERAATQKARREAFTKAQKAGLTFRLHVYLREIHPSRVRRSA